MRAEFDSEAGAISIDLEKVDRWDGGVEVHSRGHMALCGARPVNLEILYPDMGLTEPVQAAARRYSLDERALLSAAQAALAAPDRPVEITVASGRGPDLGSAA